MVIAALSLCVPAAVHAQTAAPAGSSVERGKHLYETLFTEPIRLSLEPIAPTAGITAGIGFKPKVWRTPSQIRIVGARASASTHGYWAVDGSFAWGKFRRPRVASGTVRALSQHEAAQLLRDRE